MNKRIPALLLTLLLLLPLAAACGSEPAASPADTAAAAAFFGCEKADDGVKRFVVGFDADFPPYGFKDGSEYNLLASENTSQAPSGYSSEPVSIEPYTGTPVGAGGSGYTGTPVGANGSGYTGTPVGMNGSRYT